MASVLLGAEKANRPHIVAGSRVKGETYSRREDKYKATKL